MITTFKQKKSASLERGSHTSHPPRQGQLAPRPFSAPEPSRDRLATRATERAPCCMSFADIDILPRTVLQPKLVLGPAGDKYEREADLVARQVVTSISSEKPSAPRSERGNQVQRIPAPASHISVPQGPHVAPEIEASIRQARSGGEPLPEGVRAHMEKAFGADFSGVRVHADGRADRLNRSLQARAFTTGQDIFLKQGEYRPGSSEGQRLLAHELTHFEQQRSLCSNREGNDMIAAGVTPTWCIKSQDSRGGEMIQRWIMLADPERTNLENKTPPFGYLYFNKPNERRGSPIQKKFTQLTDFFETIVKVREALEKLFGEKVKLGPVLPILRQWMGYVYKKDQEDAEIRKYMVGDVLNASMLLDPKKTSEYKDIREKVGVSAEMRYYHTYYELAWALAQEMALWGLGPLSSGGDKSHKVAEDVVQEEIVADQVMRSAWVENKLKILAGKCFYELQSRLPEANEPTAYAPLHKRVGLKDVFTGLKEENDSAQLIALLHDAKDLWLTLVKERREVTEEAFDWQTGNKRGAKTFRISKFDMRYNVGTPDEADPWVIFMRERHRPVWAGPSMTMRQMWLMARDVYANTDEMTAMGYAMFAFWSIIYPHTATPIHRFHGTMATARRYGVKYDPEKTVSQNAIDCIPDLSR